MHNKKRSTRARVPLGFALSIERFVGFTVWLESQPGKAKQLEQSIALLKTGAAAPQVRVAGGGANFSPY